MSETGNVHSTGLVLGRTGIMLRGPSGSGKSVTALALIDDYEQRGRSARLVADDRLDLAVERGQLIMRAPKSIAGLVELRGRGIVQRLFVEKARVHLVVDFVGKLERLVEEDELLVEVMGVRVARCPVPKSGVIDALHRLLLVKEALRALAAAAAVARQKTT